MAKTISKQEVEKIAKLARLGLSESELTKATQDLGNVLGHFAEIQKLDTKDVPTSDDVTGLQNVTREDAAEAEALCSTGLLLEAAPETKDGQIKVKAVFD